MSNLRTLFPDDNYNISLSGSSSQLSVLYVYNTNINAVSNGGLSCTWTVPTGASWAKFEVWGGGGGGAGSCCCQQPVMGGASGSYVRKSTRVVPGQTYTICAGGTTACSLTCCGFCGYPSYVCNASATYPVCLCASGGCGGITNCAAAWNVGYVGLSCTVGQTCGGDFCMLGHFAGGHDGGSCAWEAWHYVPSAPYKSSGVRVTLDHCYTYYGYTMLGDSPALFPGGGGASSKSYGGGCCFSSWGAGGLVVVTYR